MLHALIGEPAKNDGLKAESCFKSELLRRSNIMVPALDLQPSFPVTPPIRACVPCFCTTQTPHPPLAQTAAAPVP